MDHFSCFVTALFLLNWTFNFTGAVHITMDAVVGKDCVLPCHGLSDVRLRVLQWTFPAEKKVLLLFRGGTLLKGYEHPDYTNRVQLRDPQLRGGDLTVVLKSVTFKDKGTYTCTAVYDGQEITQIIDLTVKGEEFITVGEGEDCVLPCTGLKYLTPRTLRWIRSSEFADLLEFSGGRVQNRHEHPDYRNRVQLVDPQLQSSDLSLVLKKVTAKDSGKYQCFAQYEDGQEISQYIYLSMKDTSWKVYLGLGLGAFAICVCCRLLPGQIKCRNRSSSTAPPEQPEDIPLQVQPQHRRNAS